MSRQGIQIKFADNTKNRIIGTKWGPATLLDARFRDQNVLETFILKSMIRGLTFQENKSINTHK